MTRLVRALIVEDSESDAKTLALELRNGGRQLEFERVEDERSMRAALQERRWDIVISDWSMPRFSAMAALRVLKDTGLGIPFIIVSGAVGEDVAVEAMRAGARDFIVKDRLARLGAAVDRELHDARLVQESQAALERSAEQLRLIEARFRALIEKSADLITLTAADETALYLSPSVLRTLGREPSFYAGRSLLDIVHPDDRARMRGVLSSLLEDPTSIGQVELRAMHADGSHRWLDGTIRNLLSDPAVQGIVCNFRDVSERKRAEAEQIITQERLRQAQKLDAIGRLAAGVAHDFNNLLSVILSYSRLLADDMDVGDERRKDLERIAVAANRAAALTSQLLAFGRQQILQPKVVNLNEVVSGIEQILRKLAGEGIEISVLYGAEQGRVKVDPGPVEQVITNLVGNARDAMPAGGNLKIETADVTVDAAYAQAHPGVTPGRHVLLSVTDTGTGIDEATRSRMFEPFFTTKNTGKGTGFGLAIVLGIVEQSGGHIRVSSVLGQGSTFEVYFPQTDEEADRPTQEPQQLGSLRGNETILLVEGDQPVRTVAGAILRRYGYHVLESSGGGDALLSCEQHPTEIQLMITDVMMPRMTGLQLADRVKALRPGMQVLFMSGHADDSIVRGGMLESRLNFIQKPISPDALARKVRAVLEAR